MTTTTQIRKQQAALDAEAGELHAERAALEGEEVARRAAALDNGQTSWAGVRELVRQRREIDDALAAIQEDRIVLDEHLATATAAERDAFRPKLLEKLEGLTRDDVRLYEQAGEAVKVLGGMYDQLVTNARAREGLREAHADTFDTEGEKSDAFRQSVERFPVNFFSFMHQIAWTATSLDAQRDQAPPLLRALIPDLRVDIPNGGHSFGRGTPYNVRP